MIFLPEGLSGSSAVCKCHIEVVEPAGQPQEVALILLPYVSRGKPCIIVRQVLPEISQRPLYLGREQGTIAPVRPREVKFRHTYQQQVGELHNSQIRAL